MIKNERETITWNNQEDRQLDMTINIYQIIKTFIFSRI